MGADLEDLRRRYFLEFPRARELSEATLHVIQLSDLHIGSPEANLRIPRVQRLVQNAIDELGNGAKFALVVSGDLLDDPRIQYLDAVRSFMGSLSNLGARCLIAIPGNHDVRKQGWLRKNYEVLPGMPNLVLSTTVWLDESRVGFVCFNSVVGGRLASGVIGERQFHALANDLDLKGRPLRDYSLVAVVHHHPTPVEEPTWYGSKPFYERVLGSSFERTESMDDAGAFLDFVEGRNMSAILHGHKHIPRISQTPHAGIPILGCGSTVGKVPTKDGRPYMSMNMLSINTMRGQLSGRLLAERIPGGGLSEDMRHEILCRKAL